MVRPPWGPWIDPLGVQGTKVLDRGSGTHVWMKPLADGSKAVALVNFNDRESTVTVGWRDIGLPPGPATVRDLWTHEDLPVHTDAGTHTNQRLARKVPPHGVALLKIRAASSR